MKLEKENEMFDTWLYASDWRYSAAIVGLNKYLEFYKHEIEYELTDDYLKFHIADITEERYLKFAEFYYEDQFLHRELERYMALEQWTEDQTKRINELLKGNAVMKKVFGKIRFDGTNSSEIETRIENHRNDLIRETFRNKNNLYKNFANPGQLFKECGTCCRLWGYYVDGGRKTKSISYNFDVNTFVSEDDMLFDFIPFAFWGDREVFFVNDNFSLRQMVTTNQTLEKLVRTETSDSANKDARKALFKTIQKTADFLNYSVEVITKQRDTEFFETMYVRKESIKVLRKLKAYEPFCFSVKIADNYYLDVQKKVTECILNLVRTDELIEFFLKQDMRRDTKYSSEYLVSLLIQINNLICKGGEKLNQSMRGAYACAKAVVKVVPENKRTAYRQKLTSAVVFKDYDRYCQILLQLSNYSGVAFDFVYDLFEDFEKNKDTAYTFINALTPEKDEKKQGGETE